MVVRTVLTASFLVGALGQTALANQSPGCMAGGATLGDGKEQVLTLDEAADYLRVEPQALEAAAMREEVPARLVLGQWRFSRAVLVVWMSGVDDPENCFLTARANGETMTAGDLAEVQGAGPAAPGNDGAVATAGRPADETEAFGEQPAGESAQDVALRREEILLAAGEATIEPSIYYLSQNGDGVTLIPFGGGFLPAESQTESRTVAGTITGRYGIVDNLQAYAAGSLLYDDRKITTPAGSNSIDQTAFGDIAFGLNYGVLKEGPGRPSVILNAQGVVPTNGSNGYGAGGGLALVKSVDPVALFASANYLHTFSSEPNFAGEIQADDTIIATAGYSFALNDSLAIGTAFSGTFARFEDPGETWEDIYSLRFSLTSLLDNGLYIEPSVAFSLNDQDSQVVFGVTLPYTFVP